MWLSSCASLVAKRYAVASTAARSEKGLESVVFECCGCVVPIETASTAPQLPGALMRGWCTIQATKVGHVCAFCANMGLFGHFGVIFTPISHEWPTSVAYFVHHPPMSEPGSCGAVRVVFIGSTQPQHARKVPNWSQKLWLYPLSLANCVLATA